MKILLLGEASNYFATLAPALAELGHSVTLASHGGGWMQTERHIDLSRAHNPLGGARLYWRMLTNAELNQHYDAVFLADTSFIALRPHRQLEIFKRLKRRNGKVFLIALSTNSLLVQNLTGSNPALPFSEWQTPWGRANKHIWLQPGMVDYARYVYENVDGIATALYEYDAVTKAVVPEQNIVYAGIPVNPPIAPATKEPLEALRILVAQYPGREAEKGMDILMPIVYRALRQSGMKYELNFVSGIPFNQYSAILGASDIVVDQYYAMTPATTALMAMRGGVVPITGGHPDWLRFIGEETAPLITTDPTDPDATCQNILTGLSQIETLSQQAPAFALSSTPQAVANRLKPLLK